jgi:predicted nucleic acid-binding protein
VPRKRDSFGGAAILSGSWPRRVSSGSGLLKHSRYFRMKVELAKEVVEKALRVIRERETLPPTPAVLEAAVLFNVSAYDAEYLVVARQLSVSFLTFDQKLQQAAQGLAIAPKAFASS